MYADGGFDEDGGGSAGCLWEMLSAGVQYQREVRLPDFVIACCR